jgi:epoxyqueuosine reductase
MNGEMEYLVHHREKRRSPSLLLDGARSAICVALNYYQDLGKIQQDQPGGGNRGVFSVHVYGQDYHQVMTDMLGRLGAKLGEVYPGMRSMACVDTKPVSDRTMALGAGIAWRGKNTSVISREYGSWIFLGELLTNLDLKPDPPLNTLCEACTRCIDACPTGALEEPFIVDARKCISYLTIEKRGQISADLRKKIGLNLYGCDACQQACPFNEVAKSSSAFDRDKRSPLIDLSVDELAEISDDRFRELTRNSAVRRCGSDGMRRNAKIVRGNISSGLKTQPEEKPKK